MIQPQFSIAIKNEYCSFQVYINDIPAVLNYMGYSFNVNFPINHLVYKEKNTLKILVNIDKNNPDSKEYFEFSCEILLKGNDEPLSSLKSVFKINFKDVYKMDFNNIPTNSPLIGEFSLNFEMVNVTWAEGVNLKNDKNRNIDLSMRKLIEIHQLLKNKKLDSIFELLISREEFYAARYYENSIISYNKTKADFIETLENSDYQLQSLDFTQYLPKFYAEGKLIAFENHQGEQAIYFLNNVEKTRRQYPFYFFATSLNEIKIGL